MRYVRAAVKISVCLLSIFIVPPVTAHALMEEAGEVYTLEKTRVTLAVAGEPLRKVFDEIERQTRFLFLTAPDKMNAYPRVDLARGTYTVKEALDHVLKKTRLRYRQKNNYIVIFRPTEGLRKSAGTNDLGLVNNDSLKLSRHGSLTREDIKKIALGFLYMPLHTYRAIQKPC